MLRIQSCMTEPYAHSTTGTATSKRPRKGSTAGNACRRSIALPVASQRVGAIAWRIAVSACSIAGGAPGRPGTRITASSCKIHGPQPDLAVPPRRDNEVAVHPWQSNVDPPSPPQLHALHEGTRDAQPRAAAVLAVHVVAPAPKCGGAGEVGLPLDAGLQRPACERPADLLGSVIRDNQFIGGLAWSETAANVGSSAVAPSRRAGQSDRPQGSGDDRGTGRA